MPAAHRAGLVTAGNPVDAPRRSWLPLVLLAGIAAVGFWVFLNRDRIEMQARERTASRFVQPFEEAETADEALLRVADEAWRNARQWEAQNPGRLAEAIQRYRAVSDMYPGTAAARLAQEAEVACRERLSRN